MAAAQIMASLHSEQPAIQYPNSVTELFSITRKMKSDGVVQDKIMKYILSVAKYYNIRVRSEYASDSVITRIVLSVNRTTRSTRESQSPIIYYQCNGVVVNAITWHIISMPLRAFNRQPNTKLVNAHLESSRYDIIPIEDGTVITLYNWIGPTGSCWSISSSNAYDVSTIKWSGTRTYAQIIYDLCVRKYPSFVESSGMTLDTADDYALLQFTNLDPAYCYTFGFRHHDFHPVTHDQERIWQIRSVNMLNGIPDAADRMNGIPLQVEPIEMTEKTIASITNNCINAIIHAKAAIASGSTSAKFNYGYILRSKNIRDTREYSDIMIESPLLAVVRKMHYTRVNKPNQETPSTDVVVEYNAMRIYLSSDACRAEFIEFHPDWVGKYAQYDEYITGIVDEMMRIMRTKIPPNPSRYTKMCAKLIKHIVSSYSLTVDSKNLEQTLRDCTIIPDYAMMYLSNPHT
jgi:hypothetical protein